MPLAQHLVDRSNDVFVRRGAVTQFKQKGASLLANAPNSTSWPAALSATGGSIPRVPASHGFTSVSSAPPATATATGQWPPRTLMQSSASTHPRAPTDKAPTSIRATHLSAPCRLVASHDDNRSVAKPPAIIGRPQVRRAVLFSGSALLSASRESVAPIGARTGDKPRPVLSGSGHPPWRYKTPPSSAPLLRVELHTKESYLGRCRIFAVPGYYSTKQAACQFHSCTLRITA